MLGRHERASAPGDLPPRKRLRANVLDLVASGGISAARGLEVLQDAAAAGSSDCRQMVRPGTVGANAARTVRRHTARFSAWPHDYVAEIRVWNPKTQAVELARVSFLLPHEVMEVMGRLGNREALYQQEGLDTTSKEHLRSCEDRRGCPLIGLGLWSDGAPCNWDRSESMEIVSLNVPGLVGPYRALRVPIVALSKKNVATEATFLDIFAIVTWSLESLFAGRFPAARHDGEPFRPDVDRQRARRAGAELGLSAVLCEVRGDWKMMAEVFGLPSWSEAGGICWYCRCTKAELRDVGEGAAWRTNPLSHFELLQRIREKGRTLSPLFAAPLVRASIFRVDWLHAVDLGVAADFIGNVFAMLLPKLPGATLKDRCRSLWLRVQAYYQASQVQDKLTDLTLTMFLRPRAAPKLRASAAQARALVPFVAQAALALLPGDGLEEGVRMAAQHLQACYQALSAGAPNRQELLAASARRFALQYIALERASASPTAWRVKPKMHLFLELARQRGDPSLSWCYRDEDFGGSISRMSRRRGGALNPQHTSQRVLLNFRLKSPVPRVR